MSNADLERRVSTLETELASLMEIVDREEALKSSWWRKITGYKGEGDKSNGPAKASKKVRKVSKKSDED